MKKFDGHLKEISPSKLIKKDNNSEFDNFFLVLSLIFNDLNSLVFLTDLFIGEYPHPNKNGIEPPSVNLGYWGGIQNYSNRLTISLISEFLIFLEKNINIINSSDFKNIENKLPPIIKNEWREIKLVLEDKSNEDFLSQIAIIRNNVTFHYDQSLTQLRKGFIKKFFDSPKNQYNEIAFYSFGEVKMKTRFYYCDGSIEEYLKDHLKIQSEDDYNKKISKLVGKVDSVIKALMEIYIKYKINKKN